MTKKMYATAVVPHTCIPWGKRVCPPRTPHTSPGAVLNAPVLPRFGNKQVTLLDSALDAFLVGNTRWCTAVFAGVSSMHAAAVTLGDDHEMNPARPSADASDVAQSGGSSSTGNGNANGSSSVADQDGGRGNEDRGAVVGGVAVMSSVLKKGLLCVRSTRSSSSSSSPRPASNGGVGGGAGGEMGSGEGCDDPSAAALCLRLLRMVLQAGQAEGRAVAACVGVPTEGARRKETEAARVRLEAAAQDGGENNGKEGLSSGKLGDPIAQARGSEDGSRGGGMRDRGGGGGRRGGVRCGPPLTPALEVAVRLLADGYGVAVMFQVSGRSFYSCHIRLRSL